MATEGMALEPRFFAKVLLVAAASLAVTSLAQTSAPQSPSSPPHAPTSAATPPVFEVAAIKLNQSASGGFVSNPNTGPFTGINVSLKTLMNTTPMGFLGTGSL